MIIIIIIIVIYFAEDPFIKDITFRQPKSWFFDKKFSNFYINVIIICIIV